ncbi:MAG: RNA polymerase-binding protein RbpA [Actinomycetota bacterium]|nr:RNA polymerase-binding protein RbpA [Actinomycetota bacterium]
MGERTLRGSRLGAVSYETDRNTELAPRQDGEYLCEKGHRFAVPFAAEADMPVVWECKTDGTPAKLVDCVEPEAKKGKPPRTHWDMLLERRSVSDLEEVLTERLEVLRGKRSRTA